MITFRLDLWSPTLRHYVPLGRYDEEHARVMFEKSYVTRHTRRLVRLEETIVKKAKGEKR